MKKATEEDSGRSLCDLRIGFRESIFSLLWSMERACWRVALGLRGAMVLTVVEVLRTVELLDMLRWGEGWSLLEAMMDVDPQKGRLEKYY